MTTISSRVAVSILTFAIAAPCAFAAAGEDPGQPSAGKSADQVAKELSNPAGSLASLSNNLVYQTYKGNLPDADDQDAWSYQFQAQYFVERPDTFGGDWLYKLTVTPVIHNPFGR